MVTIDSPVRCPWDLTKEMSAYLTKLAHTSATCRISCGEELHLLESCVTSFADRRVEPAPHAKFTQFEVAMCNNRKAFLASIAHGGMKEVSYILPDRSKGSGWPRTYHKAALNAEVPAATPPILPRPCPIQLSNFSQFYSPPFGVGLVGVCLRQVPEAWSRKKGEQRLIPLRYKVSGAGLEKVNGLYYYDGKRDNMPMWRSTVGNIVLARFGGDTWYTDRHVCKHVGKHVHAHVGTLGRYISHDDHWGQNKGDYYRFKVGPGDALPPFTGWNRAINNKVDAGKPPNPTLEIVDYDVDGVPAPKKKAKISGRLCTSVYCREARSTFLSLALGRTGSTPSSTLVASTQVAAP